MKETKQNIALFSPHSPLAKDVFLKNDKQTQQPTDIAQNAAEKHYTSLTTRPAYCVSRN